METKLVAKSHTFMISGTGRVSLARSYVEYSGHIRVGADGAEGQQERKSRPPLERVVV